MLTAFEHPGLELARLADLPTDALAEAKRVVDKLAALQAKDEEESQTSQIALRRKALLRVTNFLLLISRSSLTCLSTLAAADPTYTSLGSLCTP